MSITEGVSGAQMPDLQPKIDSIMRGVVESRMAAGAPVDPETLGPVRERVEELLAQQQQQLGHTATSQR